MNENYVIDLLAIGSEKSRALVNIAMEAIIQAYDADQISQRADGRMYVEGHLMIKHMNSNFGLYWSSEVVQMDIKDVHHVFKDGESSKTELRSVVAVGLNTSVTLTDSDDKVIIKCVRPGTGAKMIANAHNIDDFIKTALTNALKKSFANFGNSLNLWEEQERDRIEKEKELKLGLSMDNRVKITRFAEEHKFSKDDIKFFIEEVFKEGVEIDNKTYKGTDKSVFYHTSQDKLVDFFLVKAEEIVEQNQKAE